MNITYSGGKITKVTDGAGREFTFTYSNNFLTSITAPDNTAIKRVKYAYKIPTVILSVIIEMFFLSIFVFLFVNLKYKESAVVLCLFAFWSWLIIKLIKNNY